MADLFAQYLSLLFVETINFRVSVRVLCKDSTEAECANILIIADLVLADEGFTLLGN
jgi:hypothetical protein